MFTYVAYIQICNFTFKREFKGRHLANKFSDI